MNKQQKISALVERFESLKGGRFRKDLDGWRLEIQSSTKKIFGLCSYEHKKIIINIFLIDHEPFHVFMDTVNHEVAHVLAPGDGHGKLWKKMAVILGAEPCSKHEINIKSSEFYSEVKPPKWVIIHKDTKKILKKYWRKPNPDTFMSVASMWQIGDPHSKGKLVLVPFEQYKSMV